MPKNRPKNQKQSLTPVPLAEYHVFLASPGDVNDERKAVREFFEEYNRTTARIWGVRFEVVDWENYSTIGIGRPQKLITKQTLEKFRDSLALLIGIMAQRFGSPTGEYESGTEEEFYWALNTYRKTGFPEIKFFFKKLKYIKELKDSSSSEKIQEAFDQRKKVLNFMGAVRNGDPQVFYAEYIHLKDFREKLRHDLSLWLADSEQPWSKPKIRIAEEIPQALNKPFMAPDLPDGFVERPAEFGKLSGLILAKNRKRPLAITTALRGAGGFGKTTLAAALCHEKRIRKTFKDGILWVTLGNENPDVLGNLTALFAALTDKRPTFVNENDAANCLAGLINNKDFLLVIDDVWREEDLRPFLHAGKGCDCIITTRFSDIAADAEHVSVDEMTTNEAAELLIKKLKPRPSNLTPYKQLAKEMGEWPLLIELANGALRRRISHGDTLDGALDFIKSIWKQRGPTAFDRDNAHDRNQAVALTVSISLNLLAENEKENYLQLGIFPEDTDIPIEAIQGLWNLSRINTEKLLEKLADSSLLKLDLAKSSVRIHDVMRKYLIDNLENMAAVHKRLIETWPNYHDLPSAYAWRWIGYHLKSAGMQAKLRKLLLDFKWLQAKLNKADIIDLINDYDYLPDDETAKLIQQTLRLSAHIIGVDKSQLASQFHGRLLGFAQDEIVSLLKQARELGGIWLRPIAPSLTAPGGAELQTLKGHTAPVTAVALTADGRAVSASDDQTLKVWDLQSGQALKTLTGHTAPVTAVALTADGRAVSASRDQTLKVWDLQSGKCIATFYADEALYCCAIAPADMIFVAAGASGHLHFLKLEGIE